MAMKDEQGGTLTRYNVTGVYLTTPNDHGVQNPTGSFEIIVWGNNVVDAAISASSTINADIIIRSIEKD